MARSVPAIRKEEVSRLYDQARGCYEKKRYEHAVQYLEKLFKFDRKHLPAHRLRANIYKQQNNQIAYSCELRMAAEIEDAEAVDFFTLADHLEKNGQNEEALKYYDKAIQCDPKPLYLERAGDCACKLQNWSLAAKRYQRIIGEDSAEADVFHKLGYALFQENKLDESFSVLRQAVHLQNGNIQTDVLLGRLYRRKKIYSQAAKYFEHAIQSDPQNAPAYYWWASLLYEQGEFQAAAETIKKASQLEPDNINYCLLHSRCLWAAGHHTEGIEVLSPLINLENPSADVLLTYSGLCRDAGKAEEAIPVIESTLKRFPWQPQLKAEYGFLLMETGRIKQAMDYFNPIPTYKK